MSWLAWQVVDSAFPVGVFAHSGGLEAAWHAGHAGDETRLLRCVTDAIQQAGWAALPLMTAVYQRPAHWPRVDDLAQAFLTNTVANRASRVQGRALAATAAAVWPSEAMAALQLQAGRPDRWAHVAPLSGAVFRIIGLPLAASQRAVLFGAARGMLSAAVRLGIVGCYGAQRMLTEVTPCLDETLSRCGGLGLDDICQTAPLLDLLQGTHDRLYSRLFQS